MKTKPKRSSAKRRLRNYLVFGEYQLHYAGYMATISAVLTTGLGWLVYHFNKVASRVVDLRALDPTDAEAQLLSQTFHRNDRLLLIGLIIFDVLLAGVLFAWQIITTSRVAGPLYYIAYQTKRMGAGFLGTLHPLRKTDMLQNFFEIFRKMHETMRDKARREAEMFMRLAERAEKGDQADLTDELRRLAQQRFDSLKDPRSPKDSGNMMSMDRPSMSGTLSD